MKAPVHGLLAAYASEKAFRAALRGLREAGCVRVDAYTPYPLENGILPQAATPVGWIMLFAGVLGASGGFFLQWFAARNYPFNVGGPALHRLAALIPLSFALT